MKDWHKFGIGVILFFLSLILYKEAGITTTAIIMSAIIGFIVAGYIIIIFIKKGGKRANFYFRGNISPEKAKYIAMKHLELHHSASLFINDGGDEDMEYTRYLVPVMAERCYPASGEESWVVKAAVHDPRFFNGLPTKILIYIDGAGNVMNDMIMNSSTVINDTLWRQPNLFFRDIVSRTARPRSVQEIIASKIEEKGEIPEGIGSSLFRNEEE